MLEGPRAVLEGRRCIASHAAESDYAPLARAMLSKLGYVILPAEEVQDPELRVVREDRLADVAGTPAVPIIVLTGKRRPIAGDPRVVGTVKRPAGPHELYRLIQAALEETPRSVPRVPTSLAARARSADEQWELELRSLSENGCLVTGAKLPALDTLLDLDIELPWGERVSARAIVAYEQGERLGLVFHGITPAARKGIAKVVTKLLERL
jgi:hypothetical protein